MIKINLCPAEELESPYWYVPDLILVVVVAFAGYFGVQYYFDGIKEQIDKHKIEISNLQNSTAQLTPDIEKFKNLGGDIEKLRGKLAALQAITVSKLERVKPVIILEHFQNLRPLGLWYQHLEFGKDKGADFVVRGQAFDNILTAEFMMSLRATASQEYDATDMRTHVYFHKLDLKKAELKTGDVEGFPDLKNLPGFEIHGAYGVRQKGSRGISSPIQPSSPSVSFSDAPPSKAG